MTHPEPFDHEEDDFVGTPVDEDDVFGKEWSRILDEFARDAPDEIRPEAGDPGVASVLAPGLVYRDVPVGVVLFDGDRPIGGYVSCDLGLAPEWRGRGLGAEIVIERCLRDGENPVLSLDDFSYSSAGVAAHRAAWRHARTHARETRARLERIEARGTGDARG